MLIIPGMDKKISEHKIREKIVVEFLTDVANEANIVFYRNESESYIVPLRIQLIISFSLLDLFANYWYEYKGETGTQSGRMTSWYDKYCRTSENEVYASDDQWKDLSSSRLSEFRNALVHFFGLGEVKPNDIYLALVSNDLPKIEIESMRTKFTNGGHPTIIVKPIEFHSLIKKGAILMLEEWANVINQSKNSQTITLQYITAIERVFNKIQKEGAVQVLKKK